MRNITPRKFLPLLALACFGAASLPALAQEVTIETATGAQTITPAPQTVVVFDVNAIDTLDALDVTIAGIPDFSLPLLADVTASVPVMGTLFEPDFEKLAMAQPDLIIAGGRSSLKAEALAQVAPTIDMTIDPTDQIAQIHARLTAYGEIFEKQDAAAQLGAELDAKIAQAAEAAQGKGNGLIILTNGGNVSAYGATSRFGWIHQALNLPEAVEGIGEATHGEAVSFEFIAQTDPDWLFVIDRGAAIGQSGEAAKATLDNALVTGTKAWKEGHVVYLNSGNIYLDTGGIQSVTSTLDDLIAAFSPES
ncbi:siderophore ABC transporter substrate-binding protein [Aquimixticola soesokkakensis]|nr:siderophore ABC transporter substrate-binding protein [Aquimixticola soesokkakensis]